jgi:hypothetical protein
MNEWERMILIAGTDYRKGCKDYAESCNTTPCGQKQESVDAVTFVCVFTGDSRGNHFVSLSLFVMPPGRLYAANVARRVLHDGQSIVPPIRRLLCKNPSDLSSQAPSHFQRECARNLCMFATQSRVSSCVALWRNTRAFSSESFWSRVIASSDLDGIMASLAKNKDDPAEQAKGCQALAILADKDESFKERMAQVGVTKVLLETLHRHALHGQACEWACMALWNMASEPETVNFIVEQGGVSILLSTLKQHMTTDHASSLQLAACGALRNLIFGTTAKDTIRSEGGLDTLLQLLSNCEQNHEVSAACMRLMCSLVDEDPEVGLHFREHGAIFSILKAMKLHKNNTLVHQSSLSLLAAIAEHPNNAEEVGKAQVIESIESSMSSNRSDMAVQALACLAFQNISSTSEQNAKRLAESGIVSHILEAMLRYHESADMQERGCAALTNLASDYEDCVADIVHKGGIDLITRAIKTHMQSRSAVCEMLRLLSAMAQIPQVVAKLIQSGTVVNVFKIMSDHSKDSDVQDACCGVLFNTMSNSPQPATSLVDQAGVRLITDVLKDFKPNTVLLEKAMAMLFIVAVQDPEFATLFGKAGAVSAVLAAMSAHKSASLQKIACGALYTLSMDSDNAMAIAKNGGVGAVIRAMNSHKKEEELQEWGCGVITYVVLQADCAIPAAREGAIEAVLSAMTTHALSESIQKAACEAAGALLQADSTMESFARLGGIGVIVRNITKQRGSEVVSERALDILTVLAQVRENAEKIVKEGGIKSAVFVLGKHPHSEGVQRAGCSLLGMLTIKSEFAVKIMQEGGAGALARAMKNLGQKNTHVMTAAAGALRGLAPYMHSKKS